MNAVRSMVVVCAAAMLVTTAVQAGTVKKPARAMPAKAAPGASTDAKAGAPDAAAANAQMMDAMAKLGAPGPMHEKLTSMEGHWKATVKTWMAPGDPTVSEGECTETMMFGGRYLVQNYKGTMMNAPFEGQGIIGYDNAQKTYVSNWIDTMSTGIMTSSGGFDEAGRMLTFMGSMPGLDGKPSPYRMVVTIVDANNHKSEMYSTMGDKEMKVMEIDYTRM